MTNAEKFEKVFGIKIDEYPSDLCDIADHKYCKNCITCHDCELFKFWGREYIDISEDKEYSKKTGEDHEEISKAFLFGVFFGYVANSDVTLSMIIEHYNELKSEVKDDE